MLKDLFPGSKYVREVIKHVLRVYKKHGKYLVSPEEDEIVLRMNETMQQGADFEKLITDYVRNMAANPEETSLYSCSFGKGSKMEEAIVSEVEKDKNFERGFEMDVVSFNGSTQSVGIIEQKCCGQALEGIDSGRVLLENIVKALN